MSGRGEWVHGGAEVGGGDRDAARGGTDRGGDAGGGGGRGLTLQPGLVIAIEPMLIEGGRDSARTLRDGWTIVTTDGSRAAHSEHTIAVTDDGPVILTAP